MIFFKPFIKWKKDLESKSSDKWLSDFPADDPILSSDNKSKKMINSKFTGTSLPHIPNDDFFEATNRNNYRDDGMLSQIPTHHHSAIDGIRGHMNSNMQAAEYDKTNRNTSISRTKSIPQQYGSHSSNVFPSYYNVSSSAISRSLAISEDFSVLDVGPYLTGTLGSTNNVPSTQTKPKKSDKFSTMEINMKHHARSTFSAASLDTALLLQDTEALLNDMEKRVYSRKDKREDTTKSQGFSTNICHGDKIPFVDEGDEKEDSSNTVTDQTEAEDNSRKNSNKTSQPITFIEDKNPEDKARSYASHSPISSGNIIRRNNSCRVGVSESMTVSRKLNPNIRSQRSCSMFEEQRLNQATNSNPTNSDVMNDYRSKSKPSFLAMNSGILINRRGSAGFCSALNSPVSRLDPGPMFNNNLSVQRSKEGFPYFSTNMLSGHRQRINRFEYGQHSLKYTSNSTTMLYNKANNASPPWNGDDNEVSPNSCYPTFDSDYDGPSTPISKYDRNQVYINAPGFEISSEADFQKREDTGEYAQHCNVSGRSSAFSPVNSLHQSTESVNNYQTASKSRSSVGINEQKQYNYDSLLVSSVHQYSARLCRYTEEIVHRMRREGSDYQGNSPVDSVFDQPESFNHLKSVNRELQETVSNLRSLEKQLQKVERFLFPVEKSGRNSAAGSCTEDNYLNQLERINKELKDFVPINDVDGSSKAQLTAEICGQYLLTTAVKDDSQGNSNLLASKEKVATRPK